jgi:hypothetical protein
VIINALSKIVISSITYFRSIHELWIKLQYKYDVSNTTEDDYIPSTSGRDELSSTPPTCCNTKGNAKVSGDEHCNVNNELTFVDPSYLSHFNALYLDLNISSIIYKYHVSIAWVSKVHHG